MKTSEKSRSLRGRLFHLFLFCAISCLFVSCGNSRPELQDPSDYISECWSFHRELKKIKKCSILELCNKVNEWEDISNRMYRHIITDVSDFDAMSSLMNACNDSIHSEIIRLAVSETRTLRDLTLFKLSVSPVVSDSALDSLWAEGERFFSSFDSYDVRRIEKPDELLLLYVNYLKTVLQDSICTEGNLCEFLRDEDILFRRFLLHLSEINGGAEQITELTSDICTHIYSQAYNGRLDERTVLAYMALRTNRRLLLNAEKCVSDITDGKITDRDLAHVYIWMILQPFMSMDPFCISMLSDIDRKRMLALADSYARCIDILSEQLQTDAADYLMIPDRILRLYLDKL